MADAQKNKNLKKMALRLLIFSTGIIILSAGITLNTKTSLGVAPIVSVSYSLSQITGLRFGLLTFYWYGVLILIQMALHLIRRPENWKMRLATDALQVVVSWFSTRFVDLFSEIIPNFAAVYPDTFAGSLPGRLLVLALAILLTGTGASMSLFTRFVPNPGDGVVQGISDFTGVSTGNTKNLFDLSCVLLTCVISLVFARRIIGVGVGTVASLLGVGRVVAAFDHLFGAKIKALREPSAGA